MELAKTAGPVAPLQQRPDAFLPDLVNSVNDLAIVLGSLDRHEEALARAEEAVRIYRQLAHQRPDVFVPDLARSLAVRGRVIAADRPSEAIESLAEAIRLLTPFFSRLPQVHAPLMQGTCSDYVQAAEAAGVAADMALPSPVIAVFEKIKSTDPT